MSDAQRPVQTETASPRATGSGAPTPGPWQVVENWDSLGYKQPASICHVGDYTIATHGPSYEFHGTDAADARLIAAAPDLLAALQGYMHAMEGFAEAVREVTRTAYPWEGQDIWRERAHVAIAKATQTATSVAPNAPPPSASTKDPSDV